MAEVEFETSQTFDLEQLLTIVGIRCEERDRGGRGGGGGLILNTNQLPIQQHVSISGPGGSALPVPQNTSHHQQHAPASAIEEGQSENTDASEGKKEKSQKPKIGQKSEPANPYKCAQCPKSYRRIYNLHEHRRVEHEGKREVCHVCGVSMKWKENLNVHLRNMHNIGHIPIKLNRIRQCHICNKKFSTNTLTFEHLKSVHGIKEPYKCSECESTFSDKQKLCVHRKTAHINVVPYRCNVCNLRFRKRTPLETHCEKYTHQAMEPARDVNDLTCYRCNKTCKTYSAFNIHMQFANTVGCFKSKKHMKCTQCKIKFDNKHDLKRHYSARHDKSLTKKSGGLYPRKSIVQARKGIMQRRNGVAEKVKPLKLQCKKCLRLVLQTPATIKQHQDWHDGKFNFKCDFCGFATVTEKLLRTHQKKHLNNSEKPFKCNKCPVGFGNRYQYLVHTYTHKDTPPPECSGCGKVCYSQNSFGQHVSYCKKRKEQQVKRTSEEMDAIKAYREGLAKSERIHNAKVKAKKYGKEFDEEEFEHKEHKRKETEPKRREEALQLQKTPCSGCNWVSTNYLGFGQHLGGCKMWQALPQSDVKAIEEECLEKYNHRSRKSHYMKLAEKRGEPFDEEKFEREDLARRKERERQRKRKGKRWAVKEDESEDVARPEEQERQRERKRECWAVIRDERSLKCSGCGLLLSNPHNYQSHLHSCHDWKALPSDVKDRQLKYVQDEIEKIRYCQRRHYARTNAQKKGEQFDEEKFKHEDLARREKRERMGKHGKAVKEDERSLRCSGCGLLLSNPYNYHFHLHSCDEWKVLPSDVKDRQLKYVQDEIEKSRYFQRRRTARIRAEKKGEQFDEEKFKCEDEATRRKNLEQFKIRDGVSSLRSLRQVNVVEADAEEDWIDKSVAGQFHKDGESSEIRTSLPRRAKSERLTWHSEEAGESGASEDDCDNDWQPSSPPCEDSSNEDDELNPAQSDLGGKDDGGGRGNDHRRWKLPETDKGVPGRSVNDHRSWKLPESDEGVSGRSVESTSQINGEIRQRVGNNDEEKSASGFDRNEDPTVSDYRDEDGEDLVSDKESDTSDDDDLAGEDIEEEDWEITKMEIVGHYRDEIFCKRVKTMRLRNYAEEIKSNECENPEGGKSNEGDRQMDDQIDDGDDVMDEAFYKTWEWVLKQKPRVVLTKLALPESLLHPLMDTPAYADYAFTEIDGELWTTKRDHRSSEEEPAEIGRVAVENGVEEMETCSSGSSPNVSDADDGMNALSSTFSEMGGEDEWQPPNYDDARTGAIRIKQEAPDVDDQAEIEHDTRRSGRKRIKTARMQQYERRQEIEHSVMNIKQEAPDVDDQDEIEHDTTRSGRKRIKTARMQQYERETEDEYGNTAIGKKRGRIGKKRQIPISIPSVRNKVSKLAKVVVPKLPPALQSLTCNTETDQIDASKENGAFQVVSTMWMDGRVEERVLVSSVEQHS